MKPIEMKEELLFDELVLTDDEMFLIRGGRSYGAGKNCGNGCGNSCGDNCGNSYSGSPF